MSNKLTDSVRTEFKLALYEQFARIGKALGNPRRLEMVDLLIQAEHTVEDLAQKTGMTVANVSQHLQVLKSCHIVHIRKEGTYVHYRIADENLLKVWQSLTDFAQESLPEINQMLGTMKESVNLETISSEELLAGLQDGSIVILDARPKDEYASGHIPQAISIPPDTLEDMLKDMPQETEFVTYCRNRYCLLSDSLAKVLQAKGYRIRLLEDGFAEWKASGLPVE